MQADPSRLLFASFLRFIRDLTRGTELQWVVRSQVLWKWLAEEGLRDGLLFLYFFARCVTFRKRRGSRIAIKAESGASCAGVFFHRLCFLVFRPSSCWYRKYIQFRCANPSSNALPKIPSDGKREFPRCSCKHERKIGPRSS